MAEKQNLSMEKSLKTWIILGLLVLGTALLSGCLGEKTSPEPANQQPDSSISAGRTGPENRRRRTDPAAAGRPASARQLWAANPGNQTQPRFRFRGRYPVPQSSPPAAPRMKSRRKRTGSRRSSEKENLLI